MVARKESQQAIERRLVRALKHLTAEELAELYLVDDWDLHGATLSAFQQRAGDALEQGIRLAESADPETRDAACWLIAVVSILVAHYTGILDAWLRGWSAWLEKMRARTRQ